MPKQQPNNNDNSADDTMKEENAIREVFEEEKKERESFSVSELLCCRVNGEKLLVPSFQRIFSVRFGLYLLIYHYKRE